MWWLELQAVGRGCRKDMWLVPGGELGCRGRKKQEISEVQWVDRARLEAKELTEVILLSLVRFHQHSVSIRNLWSGWEEGGKRKMGAEDVATNSQGLTVFHSHLYFSYLLQL